MEVDVASLRAMVTAEYAEIVRFVTSPHANDLRVSLREGSFIKIWFSLTVTGRYSYHWERRQVGGMFYRHDNAPDKNWRHVATWPKHFHDGNQQNVIESHISNEPTEALREFLNFARALVSTTSKT